MLARLIISLVSTFIEHPMTIDINPYPIDTFNMWVIVTDLRPMSFPNSIGTVWYVVALVPVFGVKCRGSLIARNIQNYPRSSPSLGTRTAIRGCSSSQISGLIRTLVGEAMIHFLAMISIQIMSNCLRTTWGYDLSRFLLHLAISDREHSGVLADSFCFCEYGINWTITVRN